MTSLCSARLTLRRFRDTDAPFILELMNEPDFRRYIGDRGVRSLEQARHYLIEGPIASYRRHDHGLMHVALRESDVPIGMCGLVRRDSLPGPDIGFALLDRYCDQGYGTEAAGIAIADARRRLGLPEVWGITQTDNARSIRILRKLGLTLVEHRPASVEDAALDIYRIRFD